PLAQRLHLAAREDEARLVAVADVVVVEGPPVDRDVAVAGRLGHPATRSRFGIAGPGTSLRFSRMRFCSSTNTTFGTCARRAAASSSQVNAAMMTRSPGLTRCAAAPFTQMTPLSGGPWTAYVSNRLPLVTFHTHTASFGSRSVASSRRWSMVIEPS